MRKKSAYGNKLTISNNIVAYREVASAAWCRRKNAGVAFDGTWFDAPLGVNFFLNVVGLFSVG